MVVVPEELLGGGFRGETGSRGVGIASNWVGKAKMVLQSFVIQVVIVMTVNFKTGDEDTLSIAARWTCYVVVYAMVIVTILSGLPYVSRLRSIDAGKSG